MIHCLASGSFAPYLGEEFYLFRWYCNKPEDYNHTVEVLKIVDQLPHYDGVVIFIVLPMSGIVEWGVQYEDKQMEVHLFTRTLGKQKEFMETFRCVWKCRTGRDYSITGDVTDWTGSVLRYAHENRHN